jgi:GTP-binding protein HflX
MTEAEVMAEDMLFATLDPTLRSLRLPGGRPAILSDTVGFISDLPHELVEAFRATLEEVQEADVILHVRDIANPDSDAQAADVELVLAQIKLGPDSDRVLIEVWNKIDLLDGDERGAVLARALRSDEGTGPLAVAVSAVSGEGLERLKQIAADHVDTGDEADVTLASGDGQALAWLYRHGRIIRRTDNEAGDVILRVRLDPQALGRFGRSFPNALVQ